MLESLKPSQTTLNKRRLLNFLIFFESILLVALTIVALQVRHIGEDLAFKNDLKEYILLISFPIIWLCCLSLFGAWDMTIIDNHIDGYQRLLKSSLMTFLVFSSASYLFKIQISRFVILFSLIGGTILHLSLRWFFLSAIDKKLRSPEKVDSWLVISEDLKESPVVQEFTNRNFAKIKYFTFAKTEQDFTKWVSEVTAEIHLSKVSKVLLAAVSEFTPVEIEQLMWAIQQAGAEFLAYDNLGLAASQSQSKHIEGFTWASFGAPQISDSLRVVKRLFDLLLVTPAIILLTPLYLLIAILIKIESRGKLLYIQERIGQDGTLFRFPKFRSMRPGSEAQRLEILGRPDESMSDRYKADPRITRAGRILRRFSLDELPQLWCVLIGSMSLVGPRPILPEEAPQLGDFHFRRQIAKPGLTGIWQVSGRKDTTWEERMAFDIKYVQQWSIALDLILIFRTFKVVLSGKGSY
jgi:exopolysaccharide biosynthesis polyprenyl glycosylphosphotransferase